MEEKELKFRKELTFARAELEGLVTMNSLLSQRHSELGKSLKMKEI